MHVLKKGKKRPRASKETPEAFLYMKRFFSAEMSYDAACDDGGSIDDGSEADHAFTSQNSVYAAVRSGKEGICSCREKIRDRQEQEMERVENIEEEAEERKTLPHSPG